MRVLVCGDRNWHSIGCIVAVLRRFHQVTPISCVIEGEARGADLIARAAAQAMGIPVECYPADWNKHGRAAGPIRNAQMLAEGKPDLVLAFHNDIQKSKGTRDMVRRAKKAGVPVKVFNFWAQEITYHEA